MLGSECDLKMHVRNLGYPIPLQNGAQNHLFWRLRSLTATLVAYIFRTKHHIKMRASALATTRGLLHRVKMKRTLVHKWLPIGSEFSCTICKFCIFLHYQASQTEISKRNWIKLCQTVEMTEITVCSSTCVLIDRRQINSCGKVSHRYLLVWTYYLFIVVIKQPDIHVVGLIFYHGFFLFFAVWSPSLLNGTHPYLATWSEVSLIWKCMSNTWEFPSTTNWGLKNHFLDNFAS